MTIYRVNLSGFYDSMVEQSPTYLKDYLALSILLCVTLESKNELHREKPNVLHIRNCITDQRLCFRYKDSTIPLLSKAEISSPLPFSVAEQPGLCQTWSESTLLVFSHRGSNIHIHFVLVFNTLFCFVLFFSFLFQQYSTVSKIVK